jgi:site-specific DNA-adenine methylase
VDFTVRAPLPYFGGKRQAASTIWALLGDPKRYVEPFAGSLAALLARPHPTNRSGYTEIVNDLDGLIVNMWRSIQMCPDATAEAASWIVSEADAMARQMACLDWMACRNVDRLTADPTYCDPTIAGYYLYAACAFIRPFASDGPWIVDHQTGRIVKQERAMRGVCRLPGINRILPRVEPNGVHNTSLRQPGVMSNITGTVHTNVMPRLLEWFRVLSARLRHVTVANGSWERVCTPAYLANAGPRNVGVFLDPPYDLSLRAKKLYTHEATDSMGDTIQQWCIANGSAPHVRIVLAGYGSEHDALLAHGWKSHESWLTSCSGGFKHDSKEERLWSSPACLPLNGPRLSLFDTTDDEDI